jgi:hypothetical protein
LLTVFPLAAIGLAAAVLAAHGSHGPPKLTWPPPPLTAPTTVDISSGPGPVVLNLDPQADYILKLPPGGLHGTLQIKGGHNVVLIGGEIIVPASANQTDNGADGTDTGIYIRHSTGIVHLEGILIRAETDVQFDGIDINAPEAVVQVENVRIDGVYGSKTTEHADVIQPWGGAKALEVDRLTADGDYQGLTIDPSVGSVRKAIIQNVDLTLDPRPAALAPITVGGGIMLWLTSGTEACNMNPVVLSHVYIVNHSHRLPSKKTFWPSPLSHLPCAARLMGRRVSWPALPVTGSVILGPPPAGPFVPEGLAGQSYVSPGYQYPSPAAVPSH